MKLRRLFSKRLCAAECALVALSIAFASLLGLPLRSAAGPSGAANVADASVLAIVGATVLDGTGREPFRATVLVRGGRVEAVGESVAVPAGARVVEAEGQTLMPGLFDLHTHLPYASAGGVSGDWPKNLKAYLYCGVTSVVEFGTYPETFEPMRRLVSSGAVPAPRIHYAARFSTPGGHGAEGGRPDFFTLEVQTPREARAAVARVLPYRPDVIKVFTDGWRYNTAPDMTSMNEETLAALVSEAHRHGIEVLTHTVTLERAKVAARAGVDVIAHGVGDREADAELARLLREKGTTYVSTLAVYEPRGRDILTPLLSAVLEPAVRERIQPPLSPAPPPDRDLAPMPPEEAAAPDAVGRTTTPAAPSETARPASPSTSPRPATPGAPAQETERARGGSAARRARWRNLLRNVGALKAGGVRFGVGTDAGVVGAHHGWATLRELRLLVAGGLSPVEAVKAATLDSARALRVEQERGSIEPGKLADLVLVAGEPHRRIADVERVTRVFLGGVELDRERLAREIAEPGLTPLPAVRVGERLDDFEGGGRPSADGLEGPRSTLGTLWVNGTEGGLDDTRMVFGRTPRRKGDHALSLMARMSSAERPFARVGLPLTRGAVEPADARGWRGVRFDARGDGGAYRLVVPTRGPRDSNPFHAPFTAGPSWQTVRIDFADLTRGDAQTPAAWTGDDLLMLAFEVARPPGSTGWLELDNLRFYR